MERLLQRPWRRAVPGGDHVRGAPARASDGAVCFGVAFLMAVA